MGQEIEVVDGDAFAPLTADEQQTGDENWRKLLEEDKERGKKASNSLLSYYWWRGSKLNEMALKPGHYGNRTVVNFATERGISRESAQLCRKFYQSFPDADKVKYLADNMISWRSCVRALPVPEGPRSDLLTQLAENKLTATEFEAKCQKFTSNEKVRKAKAGEKVDHRGGPQFKSTLKGTVSASNQLERVLDTLRTDYKPKFSKMEEGDEKSTLSSQLVDVFRALTRLQKKLEQVLKLREEKR